MSDPVIHVAQLTKDFTTTVKDPARGWFANFLRPKTTVIHAVREISFDLARGETLAFIGPNGAGKSTTIKMLTGILFPTSGEARVLGLDPHRDRKRLAMRIGTVFGQRSQLMFNLPARDSFALFGTLYEVPPDETRRRTEELIRLFDLGAFIDQPVRKLSLGQRMRAEVAVSLLHKPDVLFLDEPTIGLDLVAKRGLRTVLKRMNEELGVTLFLTSHDVSDIEALCRRTIIVNHGKIVTDASTARLRHKVLARKRIRIQLADAAAPLEPPEGAVLIDRTDDIVRLEVDTAVHSLNAVLSQLLARAEIRDLDVSSPALEEVIEHLYTRPDA